MLVLLLLGASHPKMQQQRHHCPWVSSCESQKRRRVLQTAPRYDKGYSVPLTAEKAPRADPELCQPEHSCLDSPSRKWLAYSEWQMEKPLDRTCLRAKIFGRGAIKQVHHLTSASQDPLQYRRGFWGTQTHEATFPSQTISCTHSSAPRFQVFLIPGG